MNLRAPVQLVALGAGLVLLLVGALGFAPGVTTKLGTLALAGRGSHATLLGTFRVSALVNVVHLALGIAGILLARTAETARTFVVVGGATVLALWAVGAVAVGRWLPLNADDNWLHLAFGVLLLALGALFARRSVA
jgi:Domain of unknown function (DUF4383)